MKTPTLQEMKEKAYADIVYEAGFFEDWDGTFSGLHDFCDANDFIADIFEAFGVDSANEAIREIDARLAADRVRTS